MEIEITTTKKKLTLSLVKQMPQLPYSITEMRCCKVLGYISHPSLSKQHKFVLVLYNEEYYTLRLYKWQPHRLDEIRNSYGQSITFKPSVQRDEWLELFELIKTKALKTHIYL